jgi:hypothetical protein
MPNDEYGTPSDIVESCRLVMGSIDFDPCSSVEHNKVVKATTFRCACTRGISNAFARPWPNGVTLFMNPPYSRNNINLFINHFCGWWGIQDGLKSQAIILTNSATETKWFQKIARLSDAICFPNHRISFLINGVEQKNNDRCQTIFYFGVKVVKFYNEFEKLGFTV